MISIIKLSCLITMLTLKDYNIFLHKCKDAINLAAYPDESLPAPFYDLREYFIKILRNIVFG